MKRFGQTTVAALALVYAGLAVAMTLTGRPTIDEGIYLGAGRLVTGGARLYVDFPFAQGPLVPYAYGLVLAATGGGLLAGRALSLVGALVSTGTAVAIARTHAGRLGAALALVLAIVDLPALWVATTVRTQSLATPLTLLSVRALSVRRAGALGRALAPSLLLWATAARLTEGLALAAMLAWVAFTLRGDRRTLARVGAIVGAQAALAFAPMWLAPAQAAFHVFVAQWTRAERGVAAAGALSDELVAKLAIFGSAETSFFPVAPLALGVAVALGARWLRGWRPDWRRPLGDPATAQATLLAAALLVLLPHAFLSSGFLTYFVTSSALLAPAVAIGAAEAITGSRHRRVALGVVAAMLAVGVAWVPLHWRAWVGTGPSSVAHLREVAQELRALAGPRCTMLTMETTLAFEAGCDVPPGLEYSIFSYFADLPDDRAEAVGVLNTRRVRESVAARRPELVALGPRGYDALRAALGPGRHGPGAFRNVEPSLGRLAPEGFEFDRIVEIPSGAFVRSAPDTVRVAVFVREDLR